MQTVMASSFFVHLGDTTKVSAHPKTMSIGFEDGGNDVSVFIGPRLDRIEQIEAALRELREVITGKPQKPAPGKIFFVPATPSDESASFTYGDTKEPSRA